MDTKKLKHISEFAWKIEPTGKMRVPGVIYASEELIREMDETLNSIDPQALKEENERVRPSLERRLRRLPEIPDVAEALETAVCV